MANTWNKSGTTWGYNSWQSDTVTVPLTGLSTTSSQGSLTINITATAGWGSDEWGVENWGSSGLVVPLTGLSATSAVGSISPIQETVGLAGQQATSSVGDVIIIGYLDVNIVGNTNYSDVDVVGETSYTDVTHVA